ncbi:hypothetical protein D3C72_1841850 [compost metagenome]
MYCSGVSFAATACGAAAMVSAWLAGLVAAFASVLVKSLEPASQINSGMSRTQARNTQSFAGSFFFPVCRLALLYQL